MARTSLPPGFRFHPTDVELVMYYLKRKVLGKKHHFDAIAEVNIYKFSPWDLPDKSSLKSKDLEWFFFCPREKKYASGVRVKRATENGYWKTTGKDRFIHHNNMTVGSVKTLVFHLGHPPKGDRTDWVIHEYKILDNHLAAEGVQDTYVLCKVFQKSGPGPKNGAQYGAPFNEADWTDDDAAAAAHNCDISFTFNGPSPKSVMLPAEQSCPPVTGLIDPGSTSGLPLVGESASPSAAPTTSEVDVDDAGDELDRLLAVYLDDGPPLLQENEIIQADPSGKGKNISCSDGCEIYNDLDDLDSWLHMNGAEPDLSGIQSEEYCLNMLSQDNLAYIELNDLLTPLPCSAGAIGTDQSTGGGILGSCSNGDMDQYAWISNASMDEYASRATQLHLLPEGSYRRDNNSMDMFLMGNNQLYDGSAAAYDPVLEHCEPVNGVDFIEDMERGTLKVISMSRTIPARPPSAAAQSFCCCRCGGSSIHIKAEVTHRAGECTNEALSLMMEGSSSRGICYLFVMVEFDTNEVQIYCVIMWILISWNNCYCCLNEPSFSICLLISLI